MPDRKVAVLDERIDPRIGLLVRASTEVNRNRAAQCSFVAVRDGPGPSRLEVVASAPAPRAKRTTTRRRPPAVDLSVYVQIARDADDDAKRSARDAIERLGEEVRWKQDLAAITLPAERFAALRDEPAIASIELGQTLRGPDPIVGPVTRAPSTAQRRVTARREEHEDGAGVLVGIIDVGGFDYGHEDFLDRAGGTRWEAIWDQAGTARRAPSTNHAALPGLSYGSEIRKSHMDKAITEGRRRGMAPTALEPQSLMVAGSHATHVASIAAGNRGVARAAHLAGVLIALRPEDVDVASSFYDSTRITDAVDYLVALAAELGKVHRRDRRPLPLSINISLGTNGHAHDTSSGMVRWIDAALTAPGRCVSVAAGNSGQTQPRATGDLGYVLGRIHAGGRFPATGLTRELGWTVGGDAFADTSENELEIWYACEDRFDVEVRPPGGSWIGPVPPRRSVQNLALPDGTRVSISSQTYHPANGANRISIVLSPYFGSTRGGVREVQPITGGEWKVRLTGTVVRDGRYDAWIERDDPGPSNGRGRHFPSWFTEGSYTDDRTISTLACADRIIAVANVDVASGAANVTSSRGPTRDGRNKPDIGADGTNVVAARGFDRNQAWMEMTGTSMASPYVCGVAGLLLGIDPMLTSAQILGFVRTTSRPLSGHDYAWRKDTGFGLIDADACVREVAAYAAAQQAGAAP